MLQSKKSSAGAWPLPFNEIFFKNKSNQNKDSFHFSAFAFLSYWPLKQFTGILRYRKLEVWKSNYYLSRRGEHPRWRASSWHSPRHRCRVYPSVLAWSSRPGFVPTIWLSRWERQRSWRRQRRHQTTWSSRRIQAFDPYPFWRCFVKVSLRENIKFSRWCGKGNRERNGGRKGKMVSTSKPD